MQNTDYLKIQIRSLNSNEEIPFDVFITINDKKVHYLKAGDKFDSTKITQFKKKAANSFFVKSDDKQKYKNFIQSKLSSSDTTSNEKAQLLRDSSMSLIEELFETPEVEDALKGSKAVINNFMKFMDSDLEAITQLIKLSTHDFYTYNHSLDVSIYSLGLGKILGFRGKELQELGEGSLIHDIGKRQVHVDIITKDGPLDDMEWMQMRKHPQYGLKILNEFNMSDAIKACCFEHHENMMGTGYPQKLPGSEIHPFARIIAITDTYDALTTQRTYNVPKTPEEALNFMKDKLKGKYDEEFLTAMHSVLFKIKETKAS